MTYLYLSLWGPSLVINASIYYFSNDPSVTVIYFIYNVLILKLVSFYTCISIVFGHTFTISIFSFQESNVLHPTEHVHQLADANHHIRQSVSHHGGHILGRPEHGRWAPDERQTWLPLQQHVRDGLASSPVPDPAGGPQEQTNRREGRQRRFVRQVYVHFY